jgi:hypothetical protein
VRSRKLRCADAEDSTSPPSLPLASAFKAAIRLLISPASPITSPSGNTMTTAAEQRISGKVVSFPARSCPRISPASRSSGA